MLVPQQTIQNRNCRQSWQILCSQFATKTRNPIREIVENLKFEPNPDKSFIALSIGDPTIFGNLKPSTETIEAIENVLKSSKYNGYAPSAGYLEAREAVANYINEHNNVSLQPTDIILCSGCSGALDLCLSVLGESGKNILVPRPGFSVYSTLAAGMNVEMRFYDLNEEKNWEVDLIDLELKIDDNTVGIVIINPSNPCGSVYSETHLRNILEIAARNYVPIIADEIYEHLVFPGEKFTSLATLSDTVPILVCGGLSKRYLVPGWRLGWIAIHDKNSAFEQVRKGLQAVSQRLNGANTLVQGAIKDILTKTSNSFYEELIETLYENAKLAFELLQQAPGLKAVMPQGAMYMMVKVNLDCFPQFTDGLQFVTELVQEQSVFCLPGECFNFPGYMRIVITVPGEMLQEACIRITEFCTKYYVENKHIKENEINYM